MAKKQVKPTVADPSGKVRFEVRFDEDVYQHVKQIADDAQISINQFVHALCRWAGQQCKPGEPVFDDAGVWTGSLKPQLGTVTMGVPGDYRKLSDAELKHEAAVEQMSVEEYLRHCGGKVPTWKGKTWTLDFTERRVIREDS